LRTRATLLLIDALAGRPASDAPEETAEDSVALADEPADLANKSHSANCE
jgi:hypothetical protein